MNDSFQRRTIGRPHRILLAVAGVYCLIYGAMAMFTLNMNISRYPAPPVYLHDGDALLAGGCLVAIGLMLLSVAVLFRIGAPAHPWASGLGIAAIGGIVIVPCLLLAMAAAIIKVGIAGGLEFHDQPKTNQIADD